MFATISIRRLHTAAALLLCLTLAACAPELNWREVRTDDGHASVLLPAKPATYARGIDLNGLKVEMSMTGAAVGELSFTVASVRIADAAQRPKALAAMQEAMLRNIQATKHSEKPVTLKGGVPATEVEARGRNLRNGQPLAMVARFAAHGDRVLQAVALGPQDKLSAEAAETFLGSLSLH